MGLMDDILNTVSGGQGGQNTALLGHLMNMIQNYPGGLAALVQKFHDNGLGSIITSWIGTGHNLPISASQLQNVLGSQQIKDLAAKAGISPEQAGASLSQLLPQIVDKLSPQGQLPQTGDLLQAGLNMLKNKL